MLVKEFLSKLSEARENECIISNYSEKLPVVCTCISNGKLVNCHINDINYAMADVNGEIIEALVLKAYISKEGEV